jgi:hypothetical protein
LRIARGRAVRRSRGGLFDVIEDRVENAVLLEVTTEELQRDDQARIRSDMMWVDARRAASSG